MNNCDENNYQQNVNDVNYTLKPKVICNNMDEILTASLPIAPLCYVTYGN